jgi:DNA-binding MarR family transcriptional regulator
MGAAGTGFLDDYLPYLLRRADQTLSERFYAVLTDHGVARSEWRVLAVLEELGPLGVLDLAEASLSPQPTVTHAVRRLEERGLVSRTAGEADRRQRIIAVTDEGSALTRRLMTTARDLEAEALADAGDLGGFVQRLRRLTEAVETRSHP